MERQEGSLADLVRGKFAPGEKVLAAVSGGADSVCMLLALRALAREGAIRLWAAHFEHGIRGRESIEDMEFVQRLCLRLGVELCCGRGDVPGEAARRHMGLEETAREMRRAFLRKTKEEVGADCVALAHHADDQAETVLMRLLRGTAPQGAAGMACRSGIWVRPLLEYRKEELTRLLRERSIFWREDSTNQTPDTPRNLLRLQILPLLEENWPGAVEALCRYGALQAEENAFLEKCAEEWMKKNIREYAVAARVSLDQLPDQAVLGRALKRLAGKSAQYGDVRRLAALCAAGKGKLTFRSDGFAMAEAWGGALWLVREQVLPQKTPLAPGVTPFGCIGTFTLEEWEPVPIYNDPLAQALNREWLREASVRLWQPGDRMAPLGMGGRTRLLSDIWQEKRIPAPVRAFLPVVVCKGEIVWAVGGPIAHCARIRKDTQAMRVGFRPGGEWRQSEMEKGTAPGQGGDEKDALHETRE